MGMKAVFSIVSNNMEEKLDAVYAKENIIFNLTMFGDGSADSELLDLLGLGDNKKIIYLCLVNDEAVPRLYKRLERELNLNRAGTGIAFSVPVVSASSVITKLNNYPCEKKEEIGKMPNTELDNEFELIITISQRGTFDSVKNAARSAGARGGTLIHGLGIGGDEAVKFLGINLQPEKDITLIVVNKKDKHDIMKKIVEDAGIKSETRGVCFSLPVDSAFGLASNFEDDLS